MANAVRMQTARLVIADKVEWVLRSYLGKKQAAEILLGGMARLEYRGYDSAGVAIVNAGKMTIKKKV